MKKNLNKIRIQYHLHRSFKQVKNMPIVEKDVEPVDTIPDNIKIEISKVVQRDLVPKRRYKTKKIYFQMSSMN